ncbi:hypothetical protein ABEP12_02275 [Bacillus velezensis]
MPSIKQLIEETNRKRYKKVYDSIEIGEHRHVTVDEEDGFYDDNGDLLTTVCAEVLEKTFSSHGCSVRVLLDNCHEVWLDAEDLI